MSLNAALNASVSGLAAQSAAIAAVSENIANASTTAYKTREVTFESLVTSTDSYASGTQVGGGVTYAASQDLSAQGSIEVTSTDTNLAIEGEGFFVVASSADDQPSAYMYTRNGNFSANEDGVLINDEGMILLGYRTDDDGNVTAANKNDLNSLEAIDLNTISGTAQSTTLVEFDVNLPADAATSDTFTTAYEVFDELGVSHTIEVTFTKTGANEWTVDFDDPYQTSEGSASTSTGSIDINGTGSDSLTITFNGDGSIDQIDDSSGAVDADEFTISITGLAASTGANDLTFDVDFGTTDLFDGLTQFSSDSDDPDIEISLIEQDGVRYGQLSGVEISDDGLVTAVFDNGVRIAVYQVPVATFANADGLTNVSGTIYDENEKAGNYSLHVPGEGDAGTLQSSALEMSATDTSEEFNKMIIAQQAYSSAAQVLSSVDEMFDTLITAVR